MLCYKVIDVARLGMIVARGYDCRWRADAPRARAPAMARRACERGRTRVRRRTIDAAISPENRIMVGLARRAKGAARNALKERDSDAKMSKIYAKIHGFRRDPYAEAAPPARAPRE
jgi:hypothetical protein